MKRINSFAREHGFIIALNLMAVAVVALLATTGMVDVMAYMTPENATGLMLAEGAGALELKALEKAMNTAFETMQVGIRKIQEAADTALTESKRLGTVEAKTSDKLTEISTENIRLAGEFKTVREQVLELAQKISVIPTGGGAADESIAELIAKSSQFEMAKKSGANHMGAVTIGNFHKFGRKTQIVNATGQNQPLAPDQRVGGIITPPEQRLYIRDLLPQARASSNLVQFASEATFTNNARPQGDASPGNIEGEAFAESAMTFTLANAPLVTLGHFIPASRQVLSDATMLQGHISERLIYGMKLVEEQEYLTGDGTAGKINGINNQATAFSGGATNQTVLDTILKSILQASLSNYDADAIIMHPVDWFAAIMLKDTQNRYLFSNPQDMVSPRLWMKPVVPSQSQTIGQFTTGAFKLGAQIWDLEDANIRIAEQHANFFVQGLVAILAEERTTLTVYRPTAFVKGSVSYAG